MVTQPKRSADLACLVASAPKGRGNEKPRRIYKFSKRERNCGTLVETGKRDRDTHDYNDEM